MTSGLGLEGLPDLASFLGLHESHLSLILSPQASWGFLGKQIIGVSNVTFY